MGMEIRVGSIEELCDLMCGSPEEDGWIQCENRHILMCSTCGRTVYTAGNKAQTFPATYNFCPHCGHDNRR